MSEKLRPCPNPWCKTSRPQRIRTEETIACVVRSRVECTCGAKGPMCDTEDEAIAAWNHRPVIDELIAKVQLVTDSANEMRRIRQTDLATCQGMVDRKEQMRRNAEKLSALLQEENAMLKAQVKRLEDSRFALAVAHTEDVLTIERLAFEEKSWQRDGSNATEERRNG
jgi:hypothetical protein